MEKEAWVELPSAKELGWTADTEGGYDFEFLPAMARLVMAHPQIGAPFVQLLATVMFGPGFLSRRERELIGGVTSAAQDCFY